MIASPTAITPADLAGILSRSGQYRLSASALHALCALRASGADSLTMSGLARELDLSTAAITGIADVLESRAYITRAPSAADRRIIWLNLTDRGRDALTDILTPA